MDEERSRTGQRARDWETLLVKVICVCRVARDCVKCDAMRCKAMRWEWQLLLLRNRGFGNRKGMLDVLEIVTEVTTHLQRQVGPQYSVRQGSNAESWNLDS
jgi:hypothetical protein